jgi:hypothetical protein
MGLIILFSKKKGYSNDGTLGHHGSFKNYGKTFKKGDIVGILLNLDMGTLEFLLNGEKLGLASSEVTGEFLLKLIREGPVTIACTFDGTGCEVGLNAMDPNQSLTNGGKIQIYCLPQEMKSGKHSM